MRVVVLASIFVLLAVTLVPTLRSYLRQQGDIEALRGQVSEQRQGVERPAEGAGPLERRRLRRAAGPRAAEVRQGRREVLHRDRRQALDQGAARGRQGAGRLERPPVVRPALGVGAGRRRRPGATGPPRLDRPSPADRATGRATSRPRPTSTPCRRQLGRVPARRRRGRAPLPVRRTPTCSRPSRACRTARRSRRPSTPPAPSSPAPSPPSSPRA